jgi:hypothetical protein
LYIDTVNIATGLDLGVFTKLYVTDKRRKFAFFRFGAGTDEDRSGNAQMATISPINEWRWSSAMGPDQISGRDAP